MLTEEKRKEIEDEYNLAYKLYSESEKDEDRKMFIGKCFGMERVLSMLGYEVKSRYIIIQKESL